MSYAKVLAKNAPPEERQAHPDTSLLTTAEDIAHAAPTVAPEDLTAEKAHVVDRDDFEKLRDAVEHADEVQPDHFAEAAEHRAERDQARLKSQAQAELKRTTDKVDATAEEAARKGENLAEEAADKGERLAKDAADKGQEIADETKAAAESGKKKAAEVYREGKQEAKELYSEGKKNAEQAWSEGKKDAKEIASKLEREGKAEAKKLQRKASELEREGRDLAKRYPYAASGIVGIANALLVAVPAYYAYANWHHPRWDRRIVSAVAVGLGAIFSAEGALGWFEYKQEHPSA